MLPPFEPVTGYLPPGPHVASWAEIVERFGWNERRRTLLDGLARVLRDLHQAGGRTFYLNGSFVTAKELPEDFDLCYDADEVEATQSRANFPLLFHTDMEYATARRRHYLGDILPYSWTAIWSWVDYFGTDREGIRKGYVVLILSEEPSL